VLIRCSGSIGSVIPKTSIERMNDNGLLQRTDNWSTKTMVETNNHTSRPLVSHRGRQKDRTLTTS